MFIFVFFYFLGFLSYHYRIPPYKTIMDIKNTVINKKSPGQMYIDAKVDFFNKTNPKGDIAFLGDSITDWSDWGSIFREKKIVNLGIAGNTISNMSEYSELIASTGVKKIFIMGGVNDFMLNSETVTSVFENYRKLINSTHDRNIKIVIQSTLKTRKPSDINEKISELNIALREFCNESLRCSFLNIGENLESGGALKETFTYDGVHLNGDAYAVWIAELKQSGSI
jgi:hypothetical protein